MKILNSPLLYVSSSFLAGFAVMTVELISSRIVAPIIGSSVFTWTSVIGITLLGLALGSYAGGEIADKKDGNQTLPLAFLGSAILVSIIPILSKKTGFIINSSDSILVLNLYLAVYLFLLPTFAIGIIQPIILKKFTDDFSKIGRRYGILSFAWSAGGILGVFLTGFFFISNIGSRETIWLMAALLFLVGGIFAVRKKKIAMIFLGALITMPILIYISENKTPNKKIIFQKETNYYNARVVDARISGYGNSRILALDFDIHSIEPGIKMENYPEMYPVFGNLKKEIKNILVIGAGAYTMPKYFKNYYKNAEVSVIELDKEVVEIANEFFDLKKHDIETVIGDAKVVINQDNKKYDVIFGDAYNSFISVPWYLLTKEWNEKIKGRLSDNGVYAVNFIGAIEGDKSEFTKSVLSTFRIAFPNFYIFTFGNDKKSVQNIVLVGIKGELPIGEKELRQRLSAGENSFLEKKIFPAAYFSDSTSKILTDNFSPVEKLMDPIMKNYFQQSLKLKKLLFL